MAPLCSARLHWNKPSALHTQHDEQLPAASIPFTTTSTRVCLRTRAACMRQGLVCLPIFTPICSHGSLHSCCMRPRSLACVEARRPGAGADQMYSSLGMS